MKKFRTYKKYSLVYSLDGNNGAYNISIEKTSQTGVESCSYTVNGAERDLKALVCRLWSCGVTPMSLVYILEDEGYIPAEALKFEDLKPICNSHVMRRNSSYTGKTLKAVVEKERSIKDIAVVGSGDE